MQAVKRYWSLVQVGETLPPLVRENVSRVQIVRYAGASGDFNPMHVDEIHAREAGMPSVVAPGMMLMAFMGQLVTEWAGVNGRIRSLGARFVKFVFPGDSVTCRGRVMRLGCDSGTYTVSLDLWAENQRGELVAKGSGELQLFHSPEDEERQARGEAPLLADVELPPALEERIGTPMKPLRPLSSGKKRRGSAAKKAPKSRPKTEAAAKKSPPKKTPAKGSSTAKAGAKAGPTRKAPVKKSAAKPKKAAAKKSAPRKTAAAKTKAAVKASSEGGRSRKKASSAGRSKR